MKPANAGKKYPAEVPNRDEIDRLLPLFCVISRPTKGKALYASCVREKLKRACLRAEVDKRVRPHTLRHTFATENAREGMPLPFLQRLLGHNDLATTSRYLSGLAPWEAIDAARLRTWAPLPSEPIVPA